MMIFSYSLEKLQWGSNRTAFTSTTVSLYASTLETQRWVLLQWESFFAAKMRFFCFVFLLQKWESFFAAMISFCLFFFAAKMRKFFSLIDKNPCSNAMQVKLFSPSWWCDLTKSSCGEFQIICIFLTSEPCFQNVC